MNNNTIFVNMSSEMFAKQFWHSRSFWKFVNLNAKYYVEGVLTNLGMYIVKIDKWNDYNNSIQ